MKKVLTLFFAAVLAFSLAACSGASDTVSSDNNPPQDTIVPNAETPPAQSPAESNQNTETPLPPVPAAEISVDERIILDRDGIIITMKSLSFDGWLGPELKVLIENNSEDGVTIQTRDSSVNGLMIDTMFSASVESGKKANDSITFMQSDLERAGITTVKDIEFAFHVFNSSTWDDLFDSDAVRISTTANAGYVQQYDDSGTLIYDEGGIRVVVQGKNYADSFWGADINVYVENLSSADITIQLRNTSVNGFMIDPIFSCNVLAGKRAYDSITFFESNLRDNGIEIIEETEFSLHIFNAKSWETIKDTEKVTVEFN